MLKLHLSPKAYPPAAYGHAPQLFRVMCHYSAKRFSAFNTGALTIIIAVINKKGENTRKTHIAVLRQQPVPSRHRALLRDRYAPRHVSRLPIGVPAVPSMAVPSWPFPSRFRRGPFRAFVQLLPVRLRPHRPQNIPPSSHLGGARLCPPLCC